MSSPFDAYYSEIFGNRWQDSLKPALLAPTSKVYVKGEMQGPELDYSSSPIANAYALDPASIEPVYALGVQPGESYLDVCAAPGGKSLMAIFISGCNLRARLNDSSKPRVDRLKAVLYDYLQEDFVRSLKITCSDGSRIGMRERETYDRVLADVPCSSERHHLHDDPSYPDWNLKTSKRLSVRQHAILCSALDATKSGGRVVYSTCSLSPLENDGVIEKLLKSRENQFEVLKVNRQLGEDTQYGKIILPDQCNGFGPIYYSVLQKAHLLEAAD